MQNIALLSIDIVDQADKGRAVRIVLDGSHLALDPGLVALEIDNTVAPFMSTAAVAHCDMAVVVTPSLAGQRPQERFFRFGCGKQVIGIDRAESAPICHRF